MDFFLFLFVWFEGTPGLRVYGWKQGGNVFSFSTTAVGDRPRLDPYVVWDAGCRIKTSSHFLGDGVGCGLIGVESVRCRRGLNPFTEHSTPKASILLGLIHSIQIKSYHTPRKSHHLPINLSYSNIAAQNSHPDPICQSEPTSASCSSYPTSTTCRPASTPPGL